MKPLLAAASVIGFGFLGGLASPLLTNTLDHADKPAGLDAHEYHAAVSLLGQMRTSVSSWLWLKADLYLHNGVEMRPRTQEEIDHGVAAELPAKGQEVHAESDVTVVPSHETDFRGIFGDMERATTAYKPMAHHKHNNPIVAMPLFRLMTWLDPRFELGWTTGANILAKNKSPKDLRDAMRFLYTGLQENPNSVEILVEYGRLQRDLGGDLRIPEGTFAKAVMAGLKNYGDLDDDDRDALEDAFRWLGLCERDLGNRTAMLTVASQGLRLYPDDVPLANLLAEPPLILSPKGMEVWRREHSVLATEKPHGETGNR